MRYVVQFIVAVALILVVCIPAHAEGEPTADELAKMILEGNRAEHALVAAWLDQADRGELKAVFQAIRDLRGAKRESSNDTSSADDPDTTNIPLDASHLVNIETHIVELLPSQADSILGTHRPTPELRSVSLTEKQATAMMTRVKESSTAKVVAAPRITVYDRQKCNVSIVNQVSYIKDYEVTKRGDRSVIADPVIDVIKEGVVIEMKPTVTSDKSQLDLDVTSTRAVIARPIQEKKLDLKSKDVRAFPNAAELTIQVPEVHVMKFDVAGVRMPTSGWVVLGSGIATKTEDGTDVVHVALVRAEIIKGVSNGELRLVPDNFEAPHANPPKIRKK